MIYQTMLPDKEC